MFLKAQIRALEINRIFSEEGPSSVRDVLARDSDLREYHLGEPHEYHISEPPDCSDFDIDDIKLDPYGDLFVDCDSLEDNQE